MTGLFFPGRQQHPVTPPQRYCTDISENQTDNQQDFRAQGAQEPWRVCMVAGGKPQGRARWIGVMDDEPQSGDAAKHGQGSDCPTERKTQAPQAGGTRATAAKWQQAEQQDKAEQRGLPAKATQESANAADQQQKQDNPIGYDLAVLDSWRKEKQHYAAQRGHHV